MVRIFDSQLKNTAFLYARLIDAKVAKSAFCADLEESPFYPSLLSLSKTFSKYGISNKAFKISAGEIDRLTPPFLAWLKKDARDNDFVLVTGISENSISYIYDKKEPKIISRGHFKENFKEVVWVAQPDAASDDPDFGKHVQQEKMQRYKKYSLIAGATLIFLLVILANVLTGSPLFFFMILLLKIAGCFVACLLLLYVVNKNNPIIQNICTGGNNKKTNCESVLESKAAKIYGISLGEICFFYFASTILTLLFPGFSLSLKLFLLAAANAATVPFILFSLYYQWRVVGQWCKLCLATASVLLTELVCFLFFFWQHAYLQHITIIDACVITCCIGLPVISWYALKPVFISAGERNIYYTDFKRLDNDPDIFKLRLHKQAMIYPGWESLGIAMGNPKGTIDIIMVSDLFCNPCGQAHGFLHGLAGQNKNVQLRIIFIDQHAGNSKGAAMIKHLMAIAATGGDIAHALADWYKSRNPTEIAEKYPVPEAEVENQHTRLEAMQAWCASAGIAYTPAVFVNGYELPGHYSPEELKNIL